MSSLPDLPDDYEYLKPEEIIGSGGYGKVYKIWNKRENKCSALKILQKLDSETTERFSREIKILQEIEHPNIVNIEYSCPEKSYFIMEYAAGKTLKSKGNLCFSEWLIIFKKIAQALYFAHRKGIVHRDLKPANILLSDRNEVKICDFGIGRIPGSEITKTSDFLGSVLFMAPEQIQKAKNVEPRTDLWSLSVIIYHKLANVYPYGEEKQNEYANMYAITNEKDTYKPLLEVAQGLKNISGGCEIATVCERNLQRDCQQRYEDAMAMAVDIDEIIHKFAPDKKSRKEVSYEILASEIEKFYTNLSLSCCGKCKKDITWENIKSNKAFIYKITRGRMMKWSMDCDDCFHETAGTMGNCKFLRKHEQVLILGNKENLWFARQCPKNNEEMKQRGQRAFDLITNMPAHNLLIPSDYIELNTQIGPFPFMLYPYRMGIHLKEWQNEATFSPEMIENIALQILTGLDFLHSNGLIYRALMPSSIFIDIEGKVFLDNFFLTRSQKTDCLMKSGQTITLDEPLGFLEYMSPEQMKSTNKIDKRCDIWSFGVICYYLFTNKLPFSGSGGYQTMRAVTEDSPPSLPDEVPERWRKIISKCLQKEAIDRYSSVDEIRQALV